MSMAAPKLDHGISTHFTINFPKRDGPSIQILFRFRISISKLSPWPTDYKGSHGQPTKKGAGSMAKNSALKVCDI